MDIKIEDYLDEQEIKEICKDALYQKIREDMRTGKAKRKWENGFQRWSNREWGSIGTNSLKGLFALAFQGFLIMVCVGIYAVLINGMIIADNIHSALFSVAAYTVILCFSLFKTGSPAKSIFHAH